MGRSWKENGFPGASLPHDMDANFQEIKISVPWGYITGKWWGRRDVRPLLAIHGWQDNAGTFDTLAPLLVKHHDLSLFCIDLPGHGLSSHFPPGQYYYIFWDGVHVIRRIVKHFKWPTVTLLGHSLGGGISFLYASSYPNEVEKIITIDIAAPIVRDPIKAINAMGSIVDKFLSFEHLTAEKQPCYEYKEMIDIVASAHNGSITRKSSEILMRRGMQPLSSTQNGETVKYMFTRDLRLKASVLGVMSYEQVLEMAAKIKCEVLNIRADPGIKFDRPEYFDGVIEAMKNVKKREKVIIPGTHHLHLNTPERVVDAIGKFFKS